MREINFMMLCKKKQKNTKLKEKQNFIFNIYKRELLFPVAVS